MKDYAANRALSSINYASMFMLFFLYKIVQLLVIERIIAQRSIVRSMYGSNLWIINLGAEINHCQRRSEMKEKKKTRREPLLRALYVSCSMHMKILKLWEAYMNHEISNRFDSLRLTRIYLCQRGMSARYSVIRSRRDTFFDRLSHDVSTICYPFPYYPSTDT